MEFGRYSKIKAEYIDRAVEGAFELAPLDSRLDVITDDMANWDLENEIYYLDLELKKNPLYIALERKRKMLSDQQKVREIQKSLVLEYMKKNGVKKIERNGKIITVQNRPSIETEVECLAEVPEEFIRIKREVDKVAAKKLYTETGVMTAGIKFNHKDNFSLKIKEVGNKNE